MRFLETLRNGWEARRREHRQKEVEELAAEARGESHSLDAQKDAVGDRARGSRLGGRYGSDMYG